MPPGMDPTGHFLEKTATLRGIGPRSTKDRWFHAKVATRKSPAHDLVLVVVEKGGKHREEGLLL